MWQQLIIRAVLGSVLIGAFIVANATSVNAAVDARNFDANASRGLQLSPALVELNAERGKTYKLTIRALNVTNSDQSYTSLVQDFRAKDESGTPRLLEPSELPFGASVRSWISRPGTFSLRGTQSVEIPLEVTIPNDAEPGGHYGVLTFSGGAVQLGADEQVSVTVKTGLPILIRVAGDIREDLSLETFETQRNGRQTSFFEMSPIEFAIRYKNIGNVHVKPVGSIEVTDMFGNLVGEAKVNEKASNVLPDSVRKYETAFSKDWMFGKYKATLVTGYGTTGQVVMGETEFWVIPYKLIAIIALILITLGYIARRGLKAYNAYIINQSAKTNATKKSTPAKKRSRKK